MSEGMMSLPKSCEVGFLASALSASTSTVVSKM